LRIIFANRPVRFKDFSEEAGEKPGPPAVGAAALMKI
jgi:hypothetical protein